MGSGRGDALPSLVVTAGPMELSREPTAVITVTHTRNERGALAGLKTTSYAENVIALAEANHQGASEAIFANTRGDLCEGTGTNVFLAYQDELNTPPLSSGCLAGVTRALLIEALAMRGIRVSQVPLPLEALATSREAFLVSTAREVQPISSVDGTAITAAPGPLTEAAMEAWDQAYAAGGDP
jgi:branched-chain amino acid aminotransferase